MRIHLDRQEPGKANGSKNSHCSLWGSKVWSSSRQAAAGDQQPSPAALSPQLPPEEKLVACLRDDLLVLSAQDKALNLSKLLHSFLLAGGGHHHSVLLQIPSQQHLCRAAASPAGNFFDRCINGATCIRPQTVTPSSWK